MVAGIATPPVFPDTFRSAIPWVAEYSIPVLFCYPLSRTMANLGYAAAQPPAGDNVFLGCLPPHWTEAELHGLCAPYGTIGQRAACRGDTDTAVFFVFFSPESAQLLLGNDFD